MCARCLYPENAKPAIIFDDEGICGGCRYIESRKHLEIDWSQRQEILGEIRIKQSLEQKNLEIPRLYHSRRRRKGSLLVWAMQKLWNEPLADTIIHLIRPLEIGI